MKLLDIAKKVGKGIIREVVPGGGLILNAVNGKLPDDKKLDQRTTGDQLIDKVMSMPTQDRTALLEMELDIELEEIRQGHETLRAMLESDFKTPHTTRPYIAKQAFHVIAFAIIVIISMLAYGIGTGNDQMVKTIMDNEQFILAVLGPFIALLWAYFGILRSEHKNRLKAAGGNSDPPGIIGTVLSAITNKK